MALDAPCTLESLEQHTQTLKDRAEEKRNEARDARENGNEARAKGLNEAAKRLDAASERLLKEVKEIEAERIAIEDKMEQLARASKKVVEKIGRTALSDDEFRLLRPEQMYQHITGLARGAIDSTNQKVRKTIVQAMQQWRRFGNGSEENSPFAFAAGKAAGDDLNVEKGFHAAEKAMLKEGFMIEDRSSPDGLEWWITDGNGWEAQVDNQWQAIHLADAIYRKTRLAADQLSPVGLPDFKMPLRPGKPKFDPTSDEPTMLKEVDPTHSTVLDGEKSYGMWSNFQRLIHNHISGGLDFFDNIDKLYRAKQRAQGKPETGWPLAKYALELSRKLETVNIATQEWTGKLRKAMWQSGVEWDRLAAMRIGKAMRYKDFELQRIRNQTMQDHAVELANGTITAEQIKAEANQRVAAAEKKIDADAIVHANLDAKHIVAFKRYQEITYDLLRELGVAEDDIKLGFYYRMRENLMTEKKGDAFANYNALNKDMSIEKLFQLDERVRYEQGDELKNFRDPILDPLAKAQLKGLNEILDADNAFDTFTMLARNGLRRKEAGGLISRFSNQLTPAEGQMWMLGDMRVGPEIARRFLREIEIIEGLPVEANASSNLGRKEAMVRKTLWLAKKVDQMEGKAPQFFVDALTKMYQKMGMKAAETNLQGFADGWIRLHRGQTFGVNMMIAARDMVGSDLLKLIISPTDSFWAGWKETRIPGPKLIQEYLRQRKLNWLPAIEDSVFAPELEATFQQKPHLRQMWEDLKAGKVPTNASSLASPFYWADVTQFFYKLTNIGSRMTTNKIAEHAAEKAFRNYSVSRARNPEAAMDQVLIDTGVAYSSQPAADLVRQEFQGALRTGDLSRLKMAVRTAMERETDFIFYRWNSSPYMDTAIGRWAGQYGSWARNLTGTLYRHATGPMRNLKTVEAQRAAYTSMLVKYAVAAEAIYAFGAAMNVDTSNWIPFVHNAMPPGGPMMTAVQDFRKVWMGDKETRQRLESNPVALFALLGRQFVPFAMGPNVVRRAVGQAVGPETIPDEWRKYLAIPPQQIDEYNQWLVGMGFDTSNSPVYPKFRRGGVPEAIMGGTLGRFQDYLSQMSGGGVAPGTYEALQNYVGPTGAVPGVNQ